MSLQLLTRDNLFQLQQQPLEWRTRITARQRLCLLPTTPADVLVDPFAWHRAKANKLISHALQFLRCRLLCQKCSIFLTETQFLVISKLIIWLNLLTETTRLLSHLSVTIQNSGHGNTSRHILSKYMVLCCKVFQRILFLYCIIFVVKIFQLSRIFCTGQTVAVV